MGIGAGSQCLGPTSWSSPARSAHRDVVAVLDRPRLADPVHPWRMPGIARPSLSRQLGGAARSAARLAHVTGETLPMGERRYLEMPAVLPTADSRNQPAILRRWQADRAASHASIACRNGDRSQQQGVRCRPRRARRVGDHAPARGRRLHERAHGDPRRARPAQSTRGDPLVRGAPTRPRVPRRRDGRRDHGQQHPARRVHLRQHDDPRHRGARGAPQRRDNCCIWGRRASTPARPTSRSPRTRC